MRKKVKARLFGSPVFVLFMQRQAACLGLLPEPEPKAYLSGCALDCHIKDEAN